MPGFDQVVAILDNAVGGPTSSAGPHGAFWRGVTRDEFVAKSVFGLPLIVLGDGAASNLVKALKGEAPFDGGSFNRMPAGGLAAVSAADISVIEQWIDDDAPEDDMGVTGAMLTWRTTNAPKARRHDDIWFLDPQVGWAVNSDGKIIKTSDGGANWVEQFSSPGVYLRCISFANADRGWAGTLTPSNRLLSSTDGGTTWSSVTGLPSNAPIAVCGISVVNENVVFAAGTNRPNDFPRMMKTTDGGSSWEAWEMSDHASILIDTFFTDDQHGWVVGGKANEPTPTTRDKLKPVILETSDGGATWTNRLAGQEAEFPFGEWGWKIQFLNDQVGFVSLENFTEGAILKTQDGGKTWKRLKVNDPQGNANLEGIGFVDENTGWVGGWGSASFVEGYSSATTDGGANWVDANEIGLFINRFRFFGNPVSVGYASGDTVYKYTSDPVPASATFNVDLARNMLPDAQITGSVDRVSIRMNIPVKTKRLSMSVWNRFGEEVGVVLDELRPRSGTRVFHWNVCDCKGNPVDKGQYIVRLVADDVSVSSFVCIL